MAKIPMGNFGMQIASAAPRVNVPAGAFDNGGAGMARSGAALMNTAAQLMDEQRQQDLALTRAKAANSVLDREIAVDTIGKEIEQQVATGAIPHAEAKTLYKQRVGEIAAPEIQGLDPVTAENLSKGMKRIDFKGESYIDGVVTKAVTVDFRTQADSLLDKLGKKAGLPGADLTQIKAQADSADEIGVRAYGAAWGKKKQDWIDSAWDAQLNQQAMGVRDNLQGISALQKRITEGDYAENLDSNRRNALVAKLDMYKTSLIQRQEAAAARAQREQERVLKRSEAEFNTFKTLADKGTIMSPEYIDRAIKMTVGAHRLGIQAIAKQAQETGGLAAQSIRQQQAVVDSIQTQINMHGRTPELDKRLQQAQKVLNGSVSDVKDDGLRAYVARHNEVIPPLDISSPEAFVRTGVARMELAERASLWAGKPVSPLDAAEAESIRGMLEALPPKAKSQAVATIAAAVGPKMATAVSAQIEKQDRPLSLAFAHASAKTSSGRYASELILKGANAMKDKLNIKNSFGMSRNDLQADIAKRIDGVFPDERVSSAVKESALYIAAGIAQEEGSVSDKQIKGAVEIAIGGSIIERNGKKLPTPGEMSESEFDARLRSVPASDITKQAPDGKVMVGGVEMPVADFVASVPGQELMFAGNGRYAVIVRGRPVTNAAGKPIIIGVK